MLTPKQDLDAALHAEKEWKQKKVMEAIAALHFITNVKEFIYCFVMRIPPRIPFFP